MTPRKYRKKLVVIDAIQITDQAFDAPHPDPERIPGVIYDPVHRCMYIPTLEGTTRANVGDWIIRSVVGEYYVCKPDVFEKTYEPAPDAAPSAVD